MQMSYSDLVQFADEVLSIPIKWGLDRSALLGKIYAAAMGVGCE